MQRLFGFGSFVKNLVLKYWKLALVVLVLGFCVAVVQTVRDVQSVSFSKKDFRVFKKSDVELEKESQEAEEKIGVLNDTLKYIQQSYEVEVIRIYSLDDDSLQREMWRVFEDPTGTPPAPALSGREGVCVQQN